MEFTGNIAGYAVSVVRIWSVGQCGRQLTSRSGWITFARSSSPILHGVYHCSCNALLERCWLLDPLSCRRVLGMCVINASSCCSSDLDLVGLSTLGEMKRASKSLSLYTAAMSTMSRQRLNTPRSKTLLLKQSVR